jgi:hypothetical protein
MEVLAVFEILLTEMLAGVTDRTLESLKMPEDSPGYSLLYIYIVQGTLDFIEKYQINPADEERLYSRLARLLAVLSDGDTVLTAADYKELTDKGLIPVQPGFQPDWEDPQPNKILVVKRQNLMYILRMADLEARANLGGPNVEEIKSKLHKKLSSLKG